MRSVVADGVKEIWLSSEDTGAYGMWHLLHANNLFNLVECINTRRNFVGTFDYMEMHWLILYSLINKCSHRFAVTFGYIMKECHIKMLMLFYFFFAGRDIGVNLPILLNSLVAELPSDGSTMLRIGMTNPPYILEHLKEIAEVLRHPCVYSFLHVPVQSGSDSILTVRIA